VHLDVVTTSLDAAVARATAAGAVVERPIASASWGRLAACADPFGHGFCIVEMGPRGYDALLDQEGAS
jgi:predicted enzyme related to lactoylglutathione lyase